MIVGTCRIMLRLWDVNSLKEKRQIVKKVVERTKHRFGVSVAEVDLQDLWQNAVIGVALVANDAAFANSMLDKILDSIEAMQIAEIGETEIEVIAL